MDQIAILVLTVPIVLPLIKSLGYDPLWFGVIKIVTAEVGIIRHRWASTVFVRALRTPRGRSFTACFTLRRAPDCNCDPGDLADDHSLAADEDGLLTNYKGRHNVRSIEAASARGVDVRGDSGCWQCAGEITLRLVDSLPNGHVIHELVGKPFPNSSQADQRPGHLPAFPSGAAARPRTWPSSRPSASPMSLHRAVLFVRQVSADGRRTPRHLRQRMPGIACLLQGLAQWRHPGDQEFVPNQLRPLVTLALPAYQIQLATSREVKTAKDLEAEDPHHRRRHGPDDARSAACRCGWPRPKSTNR